MKVECCICLEDLSSDGESKIQTPICGHLFHDNCINAWLNNNASCPQCRLAVNRKNLRIIHLTSSVNSDRRSSIFNSSLCQDYREVNENLLQQQESNQKEIENLKEQVQKLVVENSKLKTELCGHVKDQIGKLIMENQMLKKEIAGGYKNERPVPIFLRQQSVDSYKNVQSVVANAWKKKK